MRDSFTLAVVFYNRRLSIERVKTLLEQELNGEEKNTSGS
jgi:hypothetical protein